MARLTIAFVLLLSACTCPRVCCPARDGPRAPGATESLEAAVLRAMSARPGEAVDILALSGGGQNGAFAAGILQGWRDVGRPEFRIVTGVSIGALISSFAFLGTPEADEIIRTGFDGLDRCDVFPPRPIIAVPSEGSVYKPKGIMRVIQRHVTDDVIRAVAQASRDGERLLLTGTTNLDTGTLHVWDMTRIARNGKYDLYRRVLLASTSVPIFLPPVELQGALHVDGAVTQQIFVPSLRTAREAAGNPPVTIHAVANTAVFVDRACLPRRDLFDQGSRALITLIRSQMIDSLWRMWGMAHADGAKLRMTAVPLEHAPTGGEFLAFDPKEMAQIYRAGLAIGRDPAAWWWTPPRPLVETTR